MKRTKRPYWLWEKRMVFPRGNSLLDRGFQHIMSFNRPTFKNCQPSDINEYRDKSVNINSFLGRRQAELIKWSLFKAGTNLHTIPYTIFPLAIERHGGRGPDGKQWIRHRGGGCHRYFFWTDTYRLRPQDPDTIRERVVEIINDQIRSALIAHVSSGLRRRYIMAAEGMKVGDTILSTRLISPFSVQMNFGDCYPLGSFPIGSRICFVERFPMSGQQIAMSAGSSAIIKSKIFCEKSQKKMVIIQMPSKVNNLILDERCLAVFGQSSYVQYNQIKYGYFGQKKLDTDKRSRSGFVCLRDGRYGRRIKRDRLPVEPKRSQRHSLVDIRTF